MRFFLLLLSLFFVGCYVNQAHAWSCSTVTLVTTMSPPAMVIQRDLPVGSLIGSQVSSSVVNTFSCSNSPPPALTYQSQGIKGIGNYVTTIGGRRIFSTNIPGIGYAVGGSTLNSCNFTAWVDGTNTGDGYANNRLVCNISGVFNGPMQQQALLQFYKTGPTGSGTVSATQVASFILYNNQNEWWIPEAPVRINAFNVTTLACSVSNTNIVVNMGNVDKRAFNGTGTNPADSYTRSFTLPLNCNAGTRVNVRVDGNAQNASQGVLNLTAAANAATGVGVQLLYNNAPLQLGAIIVTGTAASAGSYNIPLRARYYQTASTIKAGVANSSANFTLTYQ